MNLKTGVTSTERPAELKTLNIQDQVQSLLRTIDEQAKHIEYQ